MSMEMYVLCARVSTDLTPLASFPAIFAAESQRAPDWSPTSRHCICCRSGAQHRGAARVRRRGRRSWSQAILTTTEIGSRTRYFCPRVPSRLRGADRWIVDVRQAIRYLESTAANFITQASMEKFIQELEADQEINLTQAETLQILNLRPSTEVEIHAVSILGTSGRRCKIIPFLSIDPRCHF